MPRVPHETSTFYERRLRWDPPRFAAYLTQHREAAELTIREFADRIGVPYAKMQRLEALGPVAPPDDDLLEGIAAVLGRRLSEVEEAAGVQRLEGRGPDTLTREQFECLSLHPNLRQSGIKTARDLPDLTPGEMRFLVQMARQVGEYVKSTGGRHTPNTILAERGLLTGGPA